jgi:hypothetical protein
MTDHDLRHLILNSRALLKRRLTKPMRERLTEQVPRWEAEAKRRGVDVSGWRALPLATAPRLTP